MYFVRFPFFVPTSLSSQLPASQTAIYIPGFNNRVFYQAPIGWEWGLAIGMTIVFMVWCELWKMIRKPLYKRWDLGLVEVNTATTTAFSSRSHSVKGGGGGDLEGGGGTLGNAVEEKVSEEKARSLEEKVQVRE